MQTSIEQIEHLRQKLNIKQTQLCELARISKSTYTRIKRGNTKMSRYTEQRLVQVLKYVAFKIDREDAAFAAVENGVAQLCQEISDADKPPAPEAYDALADERIKWRTSRDYREKQQNMLLHLERIRSYYKFKQKQMEAAGGLPLRRYQSRLYQNELITDADLQQTLLALIKLSNNPNVLQSLPEESRLYESIRQFLAKAYKKEIYGLSKPELVVLNGEALTVLKSIMGYNDRQLELAVGVPYGNIKYMLKKVQRLCSDKPVFAKNLALMTEIVKGKVLASLHEFKEQNQAEMPAAPPVQGGLDAAQGNFFEELDDAK